MVTLRHIGKSADDLRFFILSDGQHAGGITLHSVHPPRFSYGIAVAPALRQDTTAAPGFRRCLPAQKKRSRKLFISPGIPAKCTGAPKT